MDKMLYTVKEVSELLRVDIHYVYKLINIGVLPCIKLGSTKVLQQSLDEFLAKYEGYDLTDLLNIQPIHTNNL